jgi:hypothetical protein
MPRSSFATKRSTLERFAGHYGVGTAAGDIFAAG